MHGLVIDRALETDVPALLSLQKHAFATEAELYGDYSIPPLTETEDALRAELGRAVVLKAVLGGRLAGSVRGRRCGDTCQVARLAVHFDQRRRGIGAALMSAVESEFRDVRRFELFTGHRSEGNLRLYRALGYHELRRERLNDAVTLVFMEKAAPPR